MTPTENCIMFRLHMAETTNLYAGSKPILHLKEVGAAECHGVYAARFKREEGNSLLSYFSARSAISLTSLTASASWSLFSNPVFCSIFATWNLTVDISQPISAAMRV